MKSKRQRTNKQEPASKRAPVAEALQRESSLPGHGARRWIFRIAALASPFLLLLIIEVTLRVAGYGYPTSFLLPVQHNGQAMLRENPRFGWRFFPSSAARTPRPLLFPAKKPPGTVRILVLGESAAMGDPEPAYGLPRQLERILQARHPGERVEVINGAMTAISSHAVREIARDCRRVQADYWVIYGGNNEVVGPFGAGTVFGKQAPGLSAVRWNLAFKKTRIGQWLTSMINRKAEPLLWEGMEMFLGQQVRHDDPRLNKVYENYAANLDEIAKLGSGCGAKVLLATMAVNLKDSPPFGSLHRDGLAAADRTKWEGLFSSGQRAETNRAFAEAVKAYDEAAKLDSEYAEHVYRRAWCELQQGQTTATATHFGAARDLDTLRFRADSRLNAIVRQVASTRQVPLLDFEAECDRLSKPGPVGDDLFWDHVHLNFTGNYQLAKLVASRLETAWPGSTSRSSAAPDSDSEKDIARRLAFTDADQRAIVHEMRVRFQQPPFASQSNFRTRDLALGDREASLPKASLELAPAYRDALASAPDDWVLHMNFGRLLEDAGDRPGALTQWREVARLVPQWPTAWLSIGHLAEDLGQYEEAERSFRETLRLDPEAVEAMNELGVLALRDGNHHKAQQFFLSALRIRPGYNPARVNLALSMSKQGDRDRAAMEYREVLRRDTNNVEARVDLGLLLGGEGKPGEALALYEEALRLRPDYVPAHMNAAKLLVAQGRHTEAIGHYDAVLQSKPDLAQAQLELGLAYAHLGKDSEALRRLAEAARLKPDWGDTRFNYGVALAKARRFAEAAEEFRVTLQLQPGHPAAVRAFEQASRKAAGK